MTTVSPHQSAAELQGDLPSTLPPAPDGFAIPCPRTPHPQETLWDQRRQEAPLGGSLHQ